MRQWMRSLAWLAFAGVLTAQMLNTHDEAVRRIGIRLACQCGRCSDTVAACKMSMCGSSSPARERIKRQLAAGMKDDQILASFAREWGPAALRDEPGHITWMAPYALLAGGLVGLGALLRRAHARRGP